LAAAAFFLAACVLPSFPGEIHAEWTRYFVTEYRDPRDPREPPKPNQCNKTSIVTFFRLLPVDFDRLSLPREDFIDDEKLAKIEKSANEKGRAPYQGERTRDFHERDFVCGNFQGTDLRRSKFDDAKISGAIFDDAELQGASFNNADLRGASLKGGQLQGSSFNGANLQGASLSGAQLQGAFLFLTQLQGASLDGAQLQGAFSTAPSCRAHFY
jgi:uncharacterized protein YjbI with pentapeptide repeats